MVRWRLQRVSLSPEEAGLCGCWQFIAVWRERQELRKGKVIEQSEEYAFYCTSPTWRIGGVEIRKSLQINAPVF